MKRRIFQLIFLICFFQIFADSNSFTKARELAEKGFWEESYIELKNVPRSEKNADYLLLEAFVKIMTNRGTAKDEKYILENASLENRMILLLKNKNYNEVIRISSAIPSNQLSKDEQYLLGLAFLGLGNYKEAENYLGLDSVYALYYTAISQYAQGKNTESYNNFLKVTQEYPAHRLGIESHIYAAKCCIISKDYENAEKQARFAINKSINVSQKSEAALLLANLYQEQGKYQEGISLLKSLTNSYNQEIIPLKFKLSDLYYLSGDFSGANSTLESIQSFYAGTNYAEEAAFRRGQLYLDKKDYYYAKQLFSYCVNNFPSGNFIQQALYSQALATEKLGQEDEAVLLYQKITSLYPNSIYTFNSYESLAFLFYEKEEYERSLSIINYIQEKFPNETFFSSVNNLKPQLELLLSGTDKNLVDLVQQWNSNKRAETLAGMKAGVELATKYLVSVEDAPKGVDILKEILSKISENTTSYEKAKIASEANNLLALYHCINADYVFGSEYYLKAASFLMGINGEQAAESMYKAALALSNANKYQDVRLIYNKMSAIYPNSAWTNKTYSLLQTNKGE